MGHRRSRGTTAVIGISVLVCHASLFAQQEVRVCRTPNLAFGGAEGTPISISDQMEVTENVVIGELHVVVKISHAWVGDLELDLVSPMGTVVRLHDGAGGDSDDLDVVYSDGGVPNGSELFDFGCYMQVSGDGGVGALADYIGESSAGTWSLQAADTYPAATDGVLEHWCLRFFEAPPAAPPPPIEGLDCATTSDGAVLTWVNPAAYQTIGVFLNDELTASLSGSATSFTVESQPPGTEIVIAVEGVVDGSASSCPGSCTVRPLDTPPAPLTEKVVLVVIDGLRYTEGLGDPLRQHVPEMDALAAQGTIIEPFLNDYCTKTRCAIPAIMNGSWVPTHDPFFDPECQEENQYSRIPYVHEYFRRQLNRSAEDCVYVLGPYCPWRPSFMPTYGPNYWPETVATAGGDDANWAATQTILETQRPSFLTLYLPSVDSAGHSGNWANYINAIENADRIVGELWVWLQQDPEYNGSTTLIVTNDHGRHTDDFSGHGDQCEGCRTIQFLAVGPGVRAGCVSNVPRTIPDIAPTIAALLGFQTEFASGEIMTEILSYDCNDNDIPDEQEIIDGGDFDGDGEVHLDDFAAFADCLAGPDVSPSPTLGECANLCLAAFDDNDDDDVDLSDFAAFQTAFND